jgi:hypothetical protein
MTVLDVEWRILGQLRPATSAGLEIFSNMQSSGTSNIGHVVANFDIFGQILSTLHEDTVVGGARERNPNHPAVRTAGSLAHGTLDYWYNKIDASFISIWSLLLHHQRRFAYTKLQNWPDEWIQNAPGAPRVPRALVLQAGRPQVLAELLGRTIVDARPDGRQLGLGLCARVDAGRASAAPRPARRRRQCQAAPQGARPGQDRYGEGVPPRRLRHSLCAALVNRSRALVLLRPAHCTTRGCRSRRRSSRRS